LDAGLAVAVAGLAVDVALDDSGARASAAGVLAAGLAGVLAAAAGLAGVLAAAAGLAGVLVAGLAGVALAPETWSVALPAAGIVALPAVLPAALPAAWLVAVPAVLPAALPAAALPAAWLVAVLARFCAPAPRAAALAGAPSVTAVLRTAVFFAAVVCFRAAGSATAGPRAGAAFLAAVFLAVALLVVAVFDALFDLGVLVATISGFHTLRRAAGRQQGPASACERVTSAAARLHTPAATCGFRASGRSSRWSEGDRHRDMTTLRHGDTGHGVRRLRDVPGNDEPPEEDDVTAGDAEPREWLDRAGIGRSMCGSTLRSSSGPPLTNHVIQPARTIPHRLCYAEAVYHHSTSFPSRDCQVLRSTRIDTRAVCADN
jgi:hypothetical protein